MHSAKSDLQSAVAHPTVVGNYTHHELSLGRISGPYLPLLSPDVHINRFGIIPKNYQQDKWFIKDLSHLSGNCVNDGIPSQLCSLTYMTLDNTILNNLKSGTNTILAKIDIKSAFRLLLVHPVDQYLLGMRCREHHINLTPTLMQHPVIIHSSAFRLLSPHTLNWIPRFSAVVSNNSIVHFLTHSSLLHTYMSQMYPHA